jgi:23S rRNA pseudouridine1911/1915/1917 synthase
MIKQFRVSPEEAGIRLDQYLAGRLDGSRSFWQSQIKGSDVTLNKQAVKASHIVEAGEQVQVLIRNDEHTAEPPKLPIVYRDDDVVIIDKPAGLLVHGTGRNDQPTVAGAARSYTTDQTPGRPGIVHRLDKDTSGLIMVARTPEAKTYLQRLFKQHQIAKTYLALVQGRLEPAAATINLPLANTPVARLKQRVHATGRPAITNYKVVRYLSGYSLVELSPQTGRTHQLRVHLAALGHPIAGDIQYGPKHRPPGLERQFLHAAALRFTGPHGQAISATSALPPDLKHFLDQQ